MGKNTFCKFLFGLFLLISCQGFSQNVSINLSATAPVPSAVLDLSDNITGGFMLPYVSTAGRNAILTPVPNSLLIYNHDDNCIEGYFSSALQWQSLWCACTSAPTTPVITGTQTVCTGLTFTYSISTAPPYIGATDYVWTVTGGTFSNATTTITSPANSQPVTWGAGGSYTVSVTASNSCGNNATPGTLAITVNAAPSITTQPSAATQNACVGDAATALSVVATGGSLTYQWYSNAANSNVGGTSIGGATASSYTPPTTTAGTTYYYCIISGAAGCTVATSNPSGAIVVSTSPGAVTVSTAGTYCTNTTLTATGGAGGTMYWENTTVNGTSTATPSTSELVAASGTYYFGSKNAGGCWTYGSAIVTINTAPSITSGPTPASQTVGGVGTAATPIVIAASGSGVLTYQWYSNTVNSTVGGTNLGAANGAQSASYTPQTGSAGTLYYFCIVSGTCTPTATSTVASVTVSACTAITAVGTPTNAAGCTNNTVLVSTTGFTYTAGAVTGTAPTSYTWIVSGGGTWAGGVTTYAGGTSTSPVLTWGATSGTYSITVEAINACSNFTSAALVITVVPTTQTWTAEGGYTVIVPCGVTTCTVTAYGAGGGEGFTNASSGTTSGGYGGKVVATLSTIPANTTFSVYVGQAGGNATISTGGTGGYGSDEGGGNGYGDAGHTDYSDTHGYGNGGGGGGASVVRLSTNATFTADIVCAAGGGGQGPDINSSGSDVIYYGGNGGGSGTAPQQGGSSYGEGGYAGTSTKGGAAQTTFYCSTDQEACAGSTAACATAGTANGIGGNGGMTDAGYDACTYYVGGGGGGGGHYAGGGGLGGGGGGGWNSGASVGGVTTAVTTSAAGGNTTNQGKGNGGVTIVW